METLMFYVPCYESLNLIKSVWTCLLWHCPIRESRALTPTCHRREDHVPSQHPLTLGQHPLATAQLGWDSSLLDVYYTILSGRIGMPYYYFPYGFHWHEGIFPCYLWVLLGCCWKSWLCAILPSMPRQLEDGWTSLSPGGDGSSGLCMFTCSLPIHWGSGSLITAQQEWKSSLPF